MCFLKNGTRTIPINNDAADIIERLFAQYILPIYSGIPYTYNSIIKSKKEYFASWDFEGDDYAIEIKGVFQRHYPNPIFACSSAKFINIIDKNKIYIFWYVVKTPEEILNNPDVLPSKWFYYEYKKEKFTDDIKKNLITIKVNNFGQLTHYFDKSILKALQL